MCPTLPKLLPLPVLTLKLSSNSLLDTVLTHNGIPVFSIETEGSRTLVHRCDQWSGQSPVATIEWSQTGLVLTKSPVSNQSQNPVVTIDSITQPVSSFFKKSVLGGSRKFHIPGYQHPLKWKRTHSSGRFECFACSHGCTVHTAVATFEPANLTAAARLSIFIESLGPLEPSTPTFATVSTELIHYLVATAILINTPQDAWRNLTASSSTYPSPLERRDTCLIKTPSSPASSSSPSSSSGRHRLDLLSAEEDFLSPDSPTSGWSSSSLPTTPITPNTEISYHEYYSDLCRHVSTKICPKSPLNAYQITPFPVPSITVSYTRPLPRQPQIQQQQQHVQLHPQASALLLSQPIPPQATITIQEDLPPAYNEIEWTVRVPQARRHY